VTLTLGIDFLTIFIGFFAGFFFFFCSKAGKTASITPSIRFSFLLYTYTRLLSLFFFFFFNICVVLLLEMADAAGFSVEDFEPEEAMQAKIWASLASELESHIAIEGMEASRKYQQQLNLLNNLTRIANKIRSWMTRTKKLWWLCKRLPRSLWTS